MAYSASPNFDILNFECATLNCLLFVTVSRSGELIRLDIENQRFTGETIDFLVLQLLEITKNNSSSKTYFSFIRGLHVSIWLLSELLRWLCVLRSFGIFSGPLFPMAVSNSLQPGRGIDNGTYRRRLKKLGEEAGIARHLSEHSARRGCAGYHYFVLRWDIVAMYRKCNNILALRIHQILTRQRISLQWVQAPLWGMISCSWYSFLDLRKICKLCGDSAIFSSKSPTHTYSFHIIILRFPSCMHSRLFSLLRTF